VRLGLPRRVQYELTNPNQMIDAAEKLSKKVREQINANPGFFRCLLSTLLNFPLTNTVESFRSIHRYGIPVKIIWGTADTAIPYSNLSFVNSLIPNAEVHTLQNIGHEIQLECPKELSEAVIPFIQPSLNISKS